MSPATSEKQRRAAGAELARRRRGLKPKLFKGMSMAELRKMASKPRRKKSKK
jgi:hypothetical protein